MEVLGKTEHVGCFQYENGIRPTVEIRKFEQGYEEEVILQKNEIVFVTCGLGRFTFRDHPEKVLHEGEFVFIPLGGLLRYGVEENAQITVIRLNGKVSLCDGCHLEDLYRSEGLKREKVRNGICILEINYPLRLFVDGLNEVLNTDLKCREYFDTKTRELFILLRNYYSYTQLCEFFSLISSPDTEFSEYVRANHHNYKSAKELAEAMNMTPNLFSKKFIKIFGVSSIDWMRREKALRVYSELRSGRKSIAQIVEIYKFSSQPHLNKFCKAEFGENPREIRKGGLKM